MTNLIRCQLMVGLLFAEVGCAGSAPQAKIDFAAVGRYNHEMHDRFYEAWKQPSAVSFPRGKISVPVDIKIGSDGGVSDFRIAKPSGNEKIDKSIAAVGAKVLQVAPPPNTPSNGHFKLRIYFELDVKR